MQCLKCEKPMQLCPDTSPEIVQMDWGGNLDVSFYYGSRHDQMDDFGRTVRLPENPTRRDQLLRCYKIRAYICDDCFETHAHLFDGYDHKVPNLNTGRLKKTV